MQPKFPPTEWLLNKKLWYPWIIYVLGNLVNPFQSTFQNGIKLNFTKLKKNVLNQKSQVCKYAKNLLPVFIEAFNPCSTPITTSRL